MNMNIDNTITNLSDDIQKAISLLGLSDSDVKSIETVGCIAVKSDNGIITSRKLFPDLPDRLHPGWTPVRGIGEPDHVNRDRRFNIYLSRYNYETGEIIPQDQMFATIIHELIHLDQYRHSNGLYITDGPSEMDANGRAIAYLNKYTSYPCESYDFMIDETYTGNVLQYIEDITNVIYPEAESGLDLISDMSDIDIPGDMFGI